MKRQRRILSLTAAPWGNGLAPSLFAIDDAGDVWVWNRSSQDAWVPVPGLPDRPQCPSELADRPGLQCELGAKHRHEHRNGALTWIDDAAGPEANVGKKSPKVSFLAWEDPTCPGCQMAAEVRAGAGMLGPLQAWDGVTSGAGGGVGAVAIGAGCADHEQPEGK